MKLRNLFENKLTPDDIRQAVKKHLVVEVTLEGSVRKTVDYAEVYIITDVPPISEGEFRKLKDTSFEPRSLAEYIILLPVHLPKYGDKWHQWLQRMYSDSVNTSLGAMKWKQFVSYMKTSFPDEEDDDFDE